MAGYSGDSGDAMAGTRSHSTNANGKMFSTVDSDNDAFAGGSCARERSSGWWYGHCTLSAINKDGDGMFRTVNDVLDVQTSRMLLKLN